MFTRTTALAIPGGRTMLLRALALAFLAIVALTTAFAFCTGYRLAPNGTSSQHDAFAQLTRSTVPTTPDALHLQVALVQHAERGDDLALLTAAQVPLVEGEPRRVFTRFRDERLMHRHNVPSWHQHERDREIAEDSVRVDRFSMLPGGFPTTAAALTLHFVPHAVRADGCELEVTRGVVAGTASERIEQPLQPSALRVGEPLVVRVDDADLTAIVQVVPRATDDAELLTIEHWRPHVGSPMTAPDSTASPATDGIAALLVVAALLGLIAFARRAPTPLLPHTPSPSPAAMAAICFCTLLEVLGLCGLTLAVLLSLEWLRRPTARRGLLPQSLFAVGITANLLWSLRWWQLLPDTDWLDNFAAIGRLCGLLLACLWVVADRQRRGRWCIVVLFIAVFASATAHLQTALGMSYYVSRTLWIAAYATAVVAALAFLVFGGRRPAPSPTDALAVAAPA